VWTDHLGLVGLKQKDITEIDNPRLERYQEDLHGYNFSIHLIRGKEMTIYDALSRQAHFAKTGTGSEKECETDAMPVNFCRRLAGEEREAREDPLLSDIFEKAKDDDYRQWVKAAAGGVSPKSLPRGHLAREYAGAWSELSVLDGEDNTLVMFDSRKIVVPAGARDGVLATLLVPHTGEQKTWDTGRDRFFWPTLKSQISQMCSSCEECVASLPARKKEKLQASSRNMEELEPMEEIAVDLSASMGRTTSRWWTGRVDSSAIRSGGGWTPT
jgi:hypothetical protein